MRRLKDYAIGMSPAFGIGGASRVAETRQQSATLRRECYRQP